MGTVHAFEPRKRKAAQEQKLLEQRRRKKFIFKLWRGILLWALLPGTSRNAVLVGAGSALLCWFLAGNGEMLGATISAVIGLIALMHLGNLFFDRLAKRFERDSSEEVRDGLPPDAA